MHYYYSSPLSLLRCLPHFVFSPAVFFFFFDLRSIFHPSSRASLCFALRRLSDCSEQRPTHTSPKKGGEGGKKTAKEGRKEERRDNGFPSRCLPRGCSRQAGREGRQAGRRWAGGRTTVPDVRVTRHSWESFGARLIKTRKEIKKTYSQSDPI